MPAGPLRGFRDYLPPEAGARSEIRRRMRAAARRAGFVELELPSVESFELYQTKSGEGIAAETWLFQDKGDRPVALVPEQTPSLARVFVERAKSEPMPVKWFTVGKNWRYEEPQAGRTREFLQFNLDLLGVAGIEAEAELLGAAALILDEVGAKDLYAFRINDRALAEGVGRLFGATDRTRYFRAVDRYRKVPPAEFEGELEAAGVSRTKSRELGEIFRAAGPGVGPDGLDAFLSDLERRGIDDAARAGAGRLRTLFGLLGRTAIADRIVLDPTVVRGLAYYTSTVFEAFARRGEGRSIFGGGRYDHLIELFDGPATPAAGLAIGDQTLELLLKAAGRWPEGEPALDTYVVVADAKFTPDALALVDELRRGGTSADADLLGRSMSRQLREAARRRSRRALILGLKEASPGALVERDLATGAQRELARDAAAAPRA
ncbi:MAG TPA: histidine--tRNA ligase [Thermoplasmata archaeon]|nr:histidine--tRNA ligase [Thermoplasmata archaeon]